MEESDKNQEISSDKRRSWRKDCPQSSAFKVPGQEF